MIGTYAADAVIVGGNLNTNRTAGSVIGGGSGNLIEGGEFSAGAATIAGGSGNKTDADCGTIPGGTGAYANHYGQMAYASGYFAALGDAQASLYLLRKQTTSATQTELFLDGSSARMTVPSGATWTFDIHIAARSTGGASAGFHIDGVIENVSGTTAFVGSPVVTTLGADAAWSATVVADNANDALVVKVTGAASTTIRWLAAVRTTEVSQ